MISYSPGDSTFVCVESISSVGSVQTINVFSEIKDLSKVLVLGLTKTSIISSLILKCIFS